MPDEHVCCGADTGYKDIVEGIIESNGGEVARKWEDEAIDDFRGVRGRNNERVVRETQQVRSVVSSSTHAVPFGGEYNTEKEVLSPIVSLSQPVFRKETSTDRTQYPSESDVEELPRRNKILRWLMVRRTKTTETWRNEEGSMDLQ